MKQKNTYHQNLGRAGTRLPSYRYKIIIQVQYNIDFGQFLPNNGIWHFGQRHRPHQSHFTPLRGEQRLQVQGKNGIWHFGQRQRPHQRTEVLFYAVERRVAIAGIGKKIFLSKILVGVGILKKTLKYPPSAPVPSYNILRISWWWVTGPNKIKLIIKEILLWIINGKQMSILDTT